VHAVLDESWEICLATSVDGGFRHCAFVNSIWTSKGGTHVDWVVNSIVSYLQKLVNQDKDLKDTKLSTDVVKQSLWVFIKCTIANPTFNSLTRDTMTLKKSKWVSSSCDLREIHLKDICKSGLLELTVNLLKTKRKEDLSKKRSVGKKVRITGIKHLNDANYAGTKYAQYCTLILTQGDSAKALAETGLGELGRDY